MLGKKTTITQNTTHSFYCLIKEIELTGSRVDTVISADGRPMLEIFRKGSSPATNVIHESLNALRDLHIPCEAKFIDGALKISIDKEALTSAMSEKIGIKGPLKQIACSQGTQLSR